MSKVIQASTLMQVDKLGCEFNLTHALTSRKDHNGEEVAQGLPPHGRTIAYAVDEFPACPDNWMHGSAKASSFFLAVEEGKGAWLDFNSCRQDTHDIAVVISVQGINSVTGQKTTEMRLEQYKTKCPKHDVEFQQDRFCPECKYKWPAQNYLATTGTPGSLFWLDGFRSADGVIRQYIITEDEARGVAAKKLGNDRVFAIGIAFYRSKVAKPVLDHGYARGLSASSFKGYSKSNDTQLKHYFQPPSQVTYGDVPHSQDQWSISSDEPLMSPMCASMEADDVDDTYKSCLPDLPSPKLSSFSPANKPTGQCVGGQHVNSIGRLRTSSLRSVEQKTKSGILLPDVQDQPIMASGTVEKVAAKTFEVGAGACIKQDVYADPKDLDYWEEAPAGFIYINYTSKKCVEEILSAGRREESEEGFLDDVPVGN